MISILDAKTFSISTETIWNSTTVCMLMDKLATQSNPVSQTFFVSLNLLRIFIWDAYGAENQRK